MISVRTHHGFLLQVLLPYTQVHSDACQVNFRLWGEKSIPTWLPRLLTTTIVVLLHGAIFPDPQWISEARDNTPVCTMICPMHIYHPIYTVYKWGMINIKNSGTIITMYYNKVMWIWCHTKYPHPWETIHCPYDEMKQGDNIEITMKPKHCETLVLGGRCHEPVSEVLMRAHEKV